MARLALRVVTMAAAMVLATGSAAVAATPQIKMIDLGEGHIATVNDRGDIVGDSGFGGLALWRHVDYAMEDLGIGGNYWGPVGINRRADVVGHLGEGPGFLWRKGTVTSLIHPSGDPVWAVAINDRGQIAGFRATSDFAPDRPFVWQRGVFTDLGSWHDLSSGEAVDINNRGQVIVNLYSADWSEQRALLWWRDTVIDLGSLGGTHTWAVAINDRGMVVGRSEDAAGIIHPFLWRAGRMIDLWPAADDSWGSEAVAINAFGDVVGTAGGRPALWRGGTFVDICPGRFGSATAINDRGDVAGTTFDPNSLYAIRTPFRWRHHKLIDFDILAPGLVGTWVNAIDDRGRVVGTSLAEGGSDHIVVWTVNPAPAVD